MQNILTIPNAHTFNKSILNIAKAQAWNAKMNWHYKNKHEHQNENQNLDYQKHQPQHQNFNSSILIRDGKTRKSGKYTIANFSELLY